MDYNNGLKNLRSDKKQILNDIKELDKKEQEELIEEKRLIQQKYLKLKETAYSEYDKKVADVHNYCNLIEKSSTFSSKIFDDIIELISIFEGETYILEKLNYHKDNSLPSEVWETYMILSRSVFKSIKKPRYISERYLNHLLKNGIAIKIIEDWGLLRLPTKISFYKADDMGRLNPQISFKGFSYIKQFVDYIINYRIENNIEQFSEEDMHKLKEDFILLNVDNIKNNYKKKEEQRIKDISSEYEHKQKILRRMAKRIEENK